MPSARLRRMARGLASERLTGRRRAEALEWLAEPARSVIDMAAFIDRMQAARSSPPPPG